MILRTPSGFYRNIIPPRVGNSGNVTYTISSGEPPRIELNFSKVDRSSQFGKIVPDKISISPDTTIIKYNKSNLSTGMEPRPVGSTIEFNDIFIDRSGSLNVDEHSQQKEFTSARYSDNSTVDSQLLIAYDEFQSRLLTISEKTETLFTTISNDEIRLNMNISKLQAIDEALKILPDDNMLIEDKERVSSQISKLESDISDNRKIVVQSSTEKSNLINSIQRLSKVI